MPKTRTTAEAPAQTGPAVGPDPVDLKPSEIDIAKDTILYSVTTIIGAIDKPALKYWAAQCAADAAIDSERTWKAMLADRGRDEAAKWIRDAFQRPPKSMLSSGDLGSVVHKACQRYAITGHKPTPQDVRDIVEQYAGRHTDGDAEAAVACAMLDQFDNWASRFQPRALAAEMTVYHPEFGYAGQLDAAMSIDDPEGAGPLTFLVDYKSTREILDSRGKPRKPYPEQVGLQLAGYRWAKFAAWARSPRRFEEHFRRYYALNADERAMALPLEKAVGHIDTGLVIHLTPAACEAFPIRCDEPVFKFFLYCLEMFRWVNEIAPTVMGDPLQESA